MFYYCYLTNIFVINITYSKEDSNNDDNSKDNYMYIYVTKVRSGQQNR